MTHRLRLSAVGSVIKDTRLRLLGIISLLLLLTACAGSSRPAAEVPVPLVGEVSLLETVSPPHDDAMLDIAVLIFTAAPVDPQSAQVSAWLNTEIRQKETHYLPYVLRNALMRSNQWGTVRVLPQNDPSIDLLITGRIVKSDGMTLQLSIQVQDSTGRQWLNATYADETSNRDFPNTSAGNFGFEPRESEVVDPFFDIYARIVNDLLAVRNSLSAEQLGNIRSVSRMRYASDLAPETFSRNLGTGSDGLLTVTNALADNDPMLQRISDITTRHYVFIDTVDEYYAALFEEMQPLYDLWRQYSREQILETRERPIGSRNAGNNSGIQGLTQSYDRYKWAKIYEQEFAALAQGFNNEIAPAILELNRRVRGLTGSIEEQYSQWRGILRQMFEVETGTETSDSSTSSASDAVNPSL